MYIEIEDKNLGLIVRCLKVVTIVQPCIIDVAISTDHGIFVHSCGITNFNIALTVLSSRRPWMMT